MIQLRTKQERFCQIMARDIGDISATEAAIKAGYTSKTHGKAQQPNAHVIASRLMGDVRVRARISEIKRELAGEAGYTAEETRKLILDTLIDIVTTDYTDISYLITPTEQDEEAHARSIGELSEYYGAPMIDFGAVAIAPSEAMPPAHTHAIKSMKPIYHRDGSLQHIQIELYDKIAAIKLLAEMTGLLDSKTIYIPSKYEGIENDPEAIQAAMKLAQAIKEAREQGREQGQEALS